MYRVLSMVKLYMTFVGIQSDNIQSDTIQSMVSLCGHALYSVQRYMFMYRVLSHWLNFPEPHA